MEWEYRHCAREKQIADPKLTKVTARQDLRRAWGEQLQITQFNPNTKQTS